MTLCNILYTSVRRTSVSEYLRGTYPTKFVSLGRNRANLNCSEIRDDEFHSQSRDAPLMRVFARIFANMHVRASALGTCAHTPVWSSLDIMIVYPAAACCTQKSNDHLSLPLKMARQLAVLLAPRRLSYHLAHARDNYMQRSGVGNEQEDA